MGRHKGGRNGITVRGIGKDIEFGRVCPVCHKPIASRSTWCRRCQPPNHIQPRSANDAKVVQLRQANPCASLQQIGSQVGISRERVRQILKRSQQPTRRYIRRQLYYCLVCGKSTPNKNWCSQQCKYEYSYPWVECTQCHNLFRRRASNIIHPAYDARYTGKGIFCSKKCRGIWLTAHYGFAAFPEHAIHEGSKRKWDYDLIWNKYVETHYGSKRLGRLLGISSHTIDPILRKLRKAKGVTLEIAPWSRGTHRSRPDKHRTRISHRRIQVRWLARLNFSEKQIREITGCSASVYWRSIYLPRKKEAAPT